MDLRSLRYFQVVFELGSHSKAAEALRISQPAISRTVAQLEDELGRPLFTRKAHGVSPTETGRLLFERSQAILRQVENTKAEIRGAGIGLSGTLTLAVPPGAGHFLMPELIQRFRTSCPGAFLKVIAGYSSYIHEWLIRGRVDVACLHGPLLQRGFEVMPLLDEEVFLVGRPDTFPFDRDYAEASDLSRVPLILPGRPNSSRRILEETLSSLGISPLVAMEIDDTSMVRSLLMKGLGFSLLSQGAFLEYVERGELAALPFQPAMRWPLAMMLSTTRQRSPLVDFLIVTIRETAADLVASGEWPALLPKD
jgi:LysR family nitrogen assimilation transcriptional regulator